MSTPVDLGVLRARTGCGGAIAEDRGLEGHSRGPNEAVGETYWLAGAGIDHRARYRWKASSRSRGTLTAACRRSLALMRMLPISGGRPHSFPGL